MLSLFDITVPPLKHGLRTLKSLLELGEKHCQDNNVDASALLTTRLHADMYGLIFQVQMCSNTAKLLVKRLGGVESEVFPDDETTFEQLYTRIDKTIAILERAQPNSFETDNERPISVTTPLTSFTLGARDHVLTYAMPNFYFHKSTAYCILRSQGVQLSKLDFIGRNTAT